MPPGNTFALTAGPQPLPISFLKFLKAQVSLAALGSVTPENNRRVAFYLKLKATKVLVSLLITEFCVRVANAVTALSHQ